MASSDAPPESCLIASTFDPSGLAAPLDAWLRLTSLVVRTEWLNFGTALSALRDPLSAWNEHRGLSVLLVRLRDVGGDDALDRLAGDLRASHGLRRGPTAVLLPPDGASDGDGDDDGVASRLREALAGCDGISVVGERRLRAVCGWDARRHYCAFLERAARAPFAPSALAAFAGEAVRELARTLAPTRKVLCLDCDNTLWGGAVGELGAAGVSLSAPYVAAQRFFVELQRRGLLVCLVSRNEEADVRAVFEARAAEMPLRLDEHVVAVAANWRPKSENLRELARDLCLDVGSFVFVDDSPLEGAEGRAGCAESGLAVVQLPREPELYPRFLEHCWAFDPPPADDGKARRHGMSGTAVQWPACSALCPCPCATRRARRPGLRPALVSADLH